jgi:RNA polymerase sigma-70 factor (ECF subfamily)
MLEQSPLHPDKSGLSQVFEDNRSALLRFLTARTRDPSQAEDLLQDVWIKIDAHTPSGPIDNPLGYLFKTCENGVRDAKRSEIRKLAREMEKLPDRTRQIFIDFRLNEITQKDIAANLDISISAVEKHLQRAYRVIMDYRKKDDAGLDGP